MLKSTKNNLIINNAIELGENISLEDKGKGRHFTSRFIEAGLAHYQEFGDVLITKETLDRFVYTMVGCPVIIRHKDITKDNVDKERVGVVSKVWYNELDGWFWCEGIIWDKQAIDLIKNQGWSVSCTYDFESDFKKGTYHGKDYDMEFTGGEFLHLALVDNPRYERANIVVNSKDEESDTGFVTLKRKDGSTYQVKLNPENFKVDSFSKYNANLDAYKMALRADKYKDNSKLIKEVEEIQKEIADEVKYELEESTRMEKKAKGLKSLLTQLAGKYNARVQTWGNSGYEFLIEGDNLKGFSENTANDIAKRLNEYKDININAIAKHKEKSTDWAVEVKIIKENKIIDNAKDKDSNEGDITMTVLNELTEFIKSVVSNKGDDMKAENEKVDKRDIIRQIMAIAGKEEASEDVKTIAKLAEKLAYDDSEDSKADNKAKNEEDEEKEEKFKEEKEIAENKCKNEEEKEDKEEDKKEEAENEDEEEKAENKCKNSLDETRKIVFGGKQVENTKYIPISKRIEMGNQY